MTAQGTAETGVQNTLSHIAALEQRVTGLEVGVRDIATAVTNLSNKIDSTARPQWGVIWSALGVGVAILIAIGSLAYAPVGTSITEIKRDIDRQDDRFFTRAEAERGRNLNDRFFERIERRLEKLEDRKG